MMSRARIDGRVLLGGILLLALGLRGWGVSFGLPHLYHADEPIIINQAMAYGAGSLKPVYLKIPQLISQLVFLCYGGFFVILRILGVVPSPDAFGQLFLKDPTAFYLIARIIFGVLLGAFSVYLLYKLGKRLRSGNHGLIAGFLLATAFLHVRDSHFIYMDIPLLCVLIAGFFCIEDVRVRGWKRDYLRFGFFAGMAAAVKYNGIFIVVPFLAAHAGRIVRGGLRKIISGMPLLILAGVMTLVTFALLNPGSWIFAPDFFSDTSKMSEFQGFIGWTHHLFYSLTGAVGVPLLLAAALGMALSLRAGGAPLRPMLVFVSIYYFVLCVYSQEHDRYVLPLIPFLCLFAAEGLLFLSGSGPRKNVLLGIFLTLSVLPSLSKDIMCDRLLARTDIRTVALNWVEKNVPAGRKIALDVPFFMPRLKPTVAQLLEKEQQILPAGRKADLKRIQWMKASALQDTAPRYELFFMNDDLAGGFLFSQPRIPYSVDALRALGIRTVIIAKVNKNQHPDFYAELGRKARRIARFSPYKNNSREWPVSAVPLTGAPFLWTDLASRERNGHVIEIFELID